MGLRGLEKDVFPSLKNTELSTIILYSKIIMEKLDIENTSASKNERFKYHCL